VERGNQAPFSQGRLKSEEEGQARESNQKEATPAPRLAYNTLQALNRLVRRELTNKGEKPAVDICSRTSEKSKDRGSERAGDGEEEG